MFALKVNRDEKALLFKNEKLVDVLSVGRYNIFPILGRYKVNKVSLNSYGLFADEARNLYKLFKDVVKEHFNIVNLKSNQRAFIFIDDKLVDFLELGEFALYFKEFDLKVEVVDINSTVVANSRCSSYLDSFKELPNGVEKLVVDANSKAYIFSNGKLYKELDSGVYYLFSELKEGVAKVLDTRVQEMEVNNQELLTKDKATIRCNITMHYKIVDALKYLDSTQDSLNYLYKQLQFAIREHIGSKTLDEILDMPHTLSSDILSSFFRVCEAVGVEVEGVYIKDTILPGDMREIYNKVLEASKKAEANIIKRREETAATRSLLNTAKLMKDNEMLAKLKELEALEKITQNVETLNIYGGFDQFMKNSINLKDRV